MERLARAFLCCVLFMLGAALFLGAAAVFLMAAVCAALAFWAVYLVAPGQTRGFCSLARDTASKWCEQCSRASEALLGFLESFRDAAAGVRAQGDPPKKGTPPENPSSDAKSN